MKRVIHILIFVAVFLFYWNAGIENHTEADDAFAYAKTVKSANRTGLYHPHHLLYYGSSWCTYRGSQVLGYRGDAHSFLVLISSLSAAGTVLLFFLFCRRRYGLRPVASFLATGCLALSYGFWRYACEAEVIMPAAFLVLLAAYMVSAKNLHAGGVVAAACVSGASVLFHVLNGVPVFIAFPLLYLLRKKMNYAFMHLAVAVGVVGIAYLLVYDFDPLRVVSQVLGPTGAAVRIALIPKGMIGLGQCIVSGNFLFGFETFSAKLMTLFPERMLIEEVYTVRNMSAVYRILPIVSLLLLLAFGGYALIRTIKIWMQEFRLQRMETMRMPIDWRLITILCVWFVVYALAILMLEPGNPEVWVLGLIPLVLLTCGLFISPLARANQLWIVLVLVMLLGTHNYVGGIRLLKDPQTDYYQQKAAWVLQHTDQHDLIVTAGDPVFMRYLKYYAAAEVIDLNRVHPVELDILVDDTRSIYILNDVFDYEPSMKIRFPELAKQVNAYAVKLKPHVEKVADDEFGGVWILNQNSREGLIAE